MSTFGAILKDEWTRRLDRGPSPAPAATPADPWSRVLIGPENSLAHAALLALSRGDREGLSPLVLHGPPGSGKSCLTAALAADWPVRHEDAPVAFIDAETFAATCAAAGRRGEAWNALREQYRQVQLFALDDLLSLERSPLALDELAFTLDELDATGAAVVVTARTPPSQWATAELPPRLLSRLLGGLVVRLDLPGPDLRRRYAHERCRERALSLTADALDLIVASSTSFPAIDGYLARLALEARLRRRPLADLTHVRGVLADLSAADTTNSPPTIASVARAVAALYHVRVVDLRSNSRRAALVEPRHLAMHLARLHCRASHAAIGAYFGGRDPATVRHALQAAAERLQSRPDLAAAISGLRLR